MSNSINTKEIKPGQIAEWRVLDVYSGKIVKRNRVRVLELLEDGTWYVYHYGLKSCGGGWKSTDLHPIN
jgi:hypothetical protein